MLVSMNFQNEDASYVLCVIQLSTRSKLGEYNSRPPLAR